MMDSIFTTKRFWKAVAEDLTYAGKSAGKQTRKAFTKTVELSRTGIVSVYSGAFSIASRRLIRSGVSAENLVLRIRELQEKEAHDWDDDPSDATCTVL